MKPISPFFTFVPDCLFNNRVEMDDKAKSLVST